MLLAEDSEVNKEILALKEVRFNKRDRVKTTLQVLYTNCKC
jgi:hypothetical protein